MRTGLTIGLAEDIDDDGGGGARVMSGSTSNGNCAVTDARPLELRLQTQGLPLPGMDIRGGPGNTAAAARR
jgi:hypothetical protein